MPPSLDALQPSFVVSAGVAGGLDPDLRAATSSSARRSISGHRSRRRPLSSRTHGSLEAAASAAARRRPSRAARGAR